MSSHGNHPGKSQCSVPPKPPGHDQLPLWNRLANTSKRFVKRDPQLAPLGAILYLYFHQSKVSEVAKDAKGVPLAGHDKVKASGRGADLPVATDDAAGKPKGAYHTESDLAPDGAATLIYPHLERSERMNLENLTVPRNEGAFGRTMKQAAVRDRMKKDRDAEEHLKEPKEPLYGEEPRKE